MPAEELPFSINNILKLHRQSRLFSIDDILNWEPRSKCAASIIYRPTPLYAHPMVNILQEGPSYISNSVRIIRPEIKATKRKREEEDTNATKRTKTEQRQLQHICNECGSAFNHACSLKRHSEIHKNVVYNCKNCKCQFTRKDSLKRHTRNGSCSRSK